jgi:uncharacterized cupin superfamily protein
MLHAVDRKSAATRRWHTSTPECQSVGQARRTPVLNPSTDACRGVLTRHDVGMTEAYDANAVDLRFTDLPPDKCPDGVVATGVDMLAATETLEVGVWEHPVGVSTDVETDEIFVVVSGSGRVILDDGRVLDLRPGTVGVLEAGERTRWEIDETLRKVWVVER